MTVGTIIALIVWCADMTWPMAIGQAISVAAFILIIDQGIRYLLHRLNQPRILSNLLTAALLLAAVLIFTSINGISWRLAPKAASLLGWLSTGTVSLFGLVLGLRFRREMRQEMTVGKFRFQHVGLLGLLNMAPTFLIAMGLMLLCHALTREAASPLGAVFIGLACSATAAPVLAAILDDTADGSSQRLRAVALSVALVTDIIIWIMLVGLDLIHDGPSKHSGAMMLAGFIAVCVWLGLRRLAPRSWPAWLMRDVAIVLSLLGLGMEPFVICFCLGLAHSGSPFAAQSARTFDRILCRPLFPIYAASAIWLIGPIRLEFDRSLIILVIAILCVVVRYGTSLLVGRTVGLSDLEQKRLGRLLNARGIVEIVLLNKGFEMNLVDASTYLTLIFWSISITIISSIYFRFGENLLPQEDALVFRKERV